MSRKRRRFSPQDKAKIALEAIRGELTMAEIVSKYAVHASQVNTWRKQLIEHLPNAFSDNRKQLQNDLDSQLTELYEQIGRLKVENDFLKKKCSLFDGR